jgi:hypothetical protein
VIVDPDYWTPERLTKAITDKGITIQSVETVEL